MTRRLRNRLLLWYVAIVVGSLVPSSLLLDHWLADEIRSNARRELGLQARTLAEEAAHQPEAGLAAWVRTVAPIAGARVSVIDASGRVLADSEVEPAALAVMENHGQRPEIREALAGREGVRSGWSRTMGREFLDVAVPVGRPARLVVRLAVPLEQIDGMTRRGHLALGLAGLLALGLALVTGSIVAGRISRPLVTMIDAAKAMTRGDFTAPLPPPPGDEIGDLVEALSVLRRQIAERIEGLRAEGAKLRTILQAMTEGVALVDEGRVITANQAFSRLVGVRLEDDAELSACGQPEMKRLVDEARVERKPATAVLAIGERIVDATALPLGESPGQALLVLFDTTQAHQLDAMRREFVANASHELRTPVAAILAAAETLEGGADADPEARRSFLGMLFRHARRLSQLTNDLLEVSRLGAAHRHVVEAVRFPAVLGAVLPAHRLVADRRGVAVDIEIPSSLPDLYMEPMALERILNNLLDNAIKYSPDGGRVRVTASQQRGTLEITVSDEGPGIAPEHQRRIFEPFSRAGQARAPGIGGVGLGLSIVKLLVEDFGGEVAVDSAPGRGSSFVVRLPTAARESRPITEAGDP